MGALTIVCSECLNIHNHEVDKCERCKSSRLAVFNRREAPRSRDGVKRPGRGYAKIPPKIRFRRPVTEDAILLLLEAGQILTCAAVAERLRIPWTEATKGLAELARRGEIEESDGGARLYAIFGG